ncbi:hypothetical protein MUGA111182_05225 [Mucilaginibacter galii]|uniref:Uncharacterized protein n=1 Tax=Mucilaginibacter galii TaxID=2005073 RepID=A0A917N0K0_9SPHI|nr:hypothetical protein [Mucilaginibacter galii]GGI49863.1 hypothetical protein GCM10011425_10750 [Mucilaginibacter galii]
MILTIGFVVILLLIYAGVLSLVVKPHRQTKPLTFLPGTEVILLPPHRIAATGIMLIMLGVFGVAGAAVMLSQSFNYTSSLYWGALLLLATMLGITVYGLHLYFIRQQIVQLRLEPNGMYYPDLGLTPMRRPFWTLLQNKKFKFVKYTDIESIELTELFEGCKLVIRTYTGGFTMPFYDRDKYSLETLLHKINHKRQQQITAAQ